RCRGGFLHIRSRGGCLFGGRHDASSIVGFRSAEAIPFAVRKATYFQNGAAAGWLKSTGVDDRCLACCVVPAPGCELRLISAEASNPMPTMPSSMAPGPRPVAEQPS